MSEEKELLKFRKPNTIPPGGYKYIDPNKDFFILGSNFSDLVRRVLMYRKANDFEIEDNLEEIIEDWICQQIPLNFTSAYTKNSHMVITNASGATIQGCTKKVLHAFRKNNRIMVSLEQAKKRSDICRKCPMNVAKSACSSCVGLDAWVRGWVKGPKEYEEKLQVCSASAIMNIAQIYVPIEVLKSILPKKQIDNYDENCWKIKEINNARTNT